MRTLIACLLAFPALCCAADKPCTPEWKWLGWFDFRLEGFTYHGVTVKFVESVDPKDDVPQKDKDGKDVFEGKLKGPLKVKITGGTQAGEKTIQRMDWVNAQNGCTAQNVPKDIKTLFGIPDNPPALVTVLPPAMANLTWDEGDLNGDASRDHINTSTNGIRVLIGRSDETFETAVNYPTGPGAAAVELADLNGDGKTDAAVANAGTFGQNNGSLSVLLGRGDGTFQPAAQYASGPSAVALYVDDFNGDQRKDIALVRTGATNAPGEVAVLLGTGAGSFGAPVSYAVGVGPISVVAADLNGDGRLDLAVANRDGNSLSVLLGTGTGAFTPGPLVPVGPQPNFLGAMDLNRDARADLVVLHATSATLSVWLSQANGTMVSAGRYLTGVGADSFEILGYHDDPLQVIAPDAAKTWFFRYGVNPDGTLTGAPVYDVGTARSALALGDFNQDSRLDIVTVGSSSSMNLLTGAGRGDFNPPQPVPLPANASAVAAGDFSGDGRTDVAVATLNGIAIMTSQGTGFQQGATLTAPAGITSLIALDLNADSRLDLVAAATGSQNASTVVVFLGNGNGTFQAGASYPAGFDTRTVTAGDLNGDSRPDLVAVSHGDLVARRAALNVFLANSNGTFQPAVSIDAGVSADSAVIGDFNGDGRADIAYSGLSENSPNFLFGVSLLRGHGNGTFQPPALTRLGDQTGALVTGDFNRDGKTDILQAACCGNTLLKLLLSNGDGTFRVEDLPGGADPIAIAAAHLNQDPWLDIVVLDAPNGSRLNGVVSIVMGSAPAVRHTSAATNGISVLAPDSIVAAYGLGLATATAVAPGADWPETLAGTKVRVRDETGKELAARIYYASPTQVNYWMPAGLAPGFVLVTIIPAEGDPVQSVQRVEVTAPGLFVVDANAAAAAFVTRVSGGVQTTEPVVQVNPNGTLFLRPIDLGSDADDAVLLLFGTGIRGHPGLDSMKATIGGVAADILYAGPQGQYLGFDQVNIRIPKTLRGRGRVDIRLTVDGDPVNPVRVQIR